MKQDLFKPFIFEKWLVVGFTAFLAALGGGGGNNFSFQVPGGNAPELYDLREIPGIVRDWFLENPVWLVIGLVFLGLLFVLWIVFVWVSSRGKFMFLDNVIHNRWQVVEPWGRFKGLGNSLFVWRLAFGLLSLVFFAILAFGFIWAWIKNVGESESFFFFAPQILVFIIVMLLVGILIGAISLALDHFVVPLMVKNQLTCMEAWRKFIELFLAHKMGFALYGLLVIGLFICAVMVTIVLGILTCCCGFLIMAVPYVGTVITLPIPYFFRTFSIAFLAQFGEEFDVLDQEMGAS